MLPKILKIIKIEHNKLFSYIKNSKILKEKSNKFKIKIKKLFKKYIDNAISKKRLHKHSKQQVKDQ